MSTIPSAPHNGRRSRRLPVRTRHLQVALPAGLCYHTPVHKKHSGKAGYDDMWFWKKKREKAATGNSAAGRADRETGLEYDLTESLRKAATKGGLRPGDISLSIMFDGRGKPTTVDRSVVFLGDGKKVAEWRVESLRSLFRGNRQPPPTARMERYPEQYVPFFHGIEYNVYRFCREMESAPVDNEFLDIYSQMRRRPDGRSLAQLHDVVWRSAALVLGLSPWSEAEYTAVFGQLARSARHFKMGGSSRNYIAYVRQLMEKSGA
jgi:hypothetical protein